MSEPVDDFLMHYGVKGMKWGKRQSTTGEAKPKMSREKKVAIAVGVGATVAVGAAVAYGIMSGKKVDIPPVQTLTTNKTVMAGKANLIFNAAAMDRTSPTNIPVQTLTTNKTMMAGKANLIFNAAAMPRKDIADIPVPKLTTNKTMLAGKANLIFSAAAMSAPVPPAPSKGLVEKVKEKGFDTAKSVAIKKLQSTTYDDLKSLGTNPTRSGFKDKTTGFVKDRTNEVIIRKIAGAASAKVKQIDESKKKR